MRLRYSFLAPATALLVLHCGPAGVDDHAPLENDSEQGAGELPSRAAAASPLLAVRGFTAAGTGCPAGTTSAVAQEQNGVQALAVLFNAFAAEGASPVSGRARGELKTCNLAVTIEPLQGYQLALANIETRGSVDVFGRRDTTRGVNNAVAVSREFFFNSADNLYGFRFPILDTYLVNSSSNYTIQENTTGTVTYGPCNARFIARGRLSLNVTGASNYGDISAIDQNSSLRFNILARACTGTTPPPGIQDITGENRATIKNACALRGVGTGSRTEVCYGANGEVLSTRPDT
jgi:hypothetical protein